MDWEKLYQDWLLCCNAKNHNQRLKIERQAGTLLENRKLKDVSWLVQVLEQQTVEFRMKRLFIINSLRKNNQIPKSLFLPLIRAAIYESNPSLNRYFIEPCIRCCGSYQVNSELINRYMENGNNNEKAGLAKVLYWSLRRDNSENIEDLIDKVNCWYLTEFVNNQNINFRRCIIPNLQLESWIYPQELHSLIPKAIDIAISHPDEYIRHRVKIQLGYSSSYMPLPY
ncbi:hypothetical protein NIES267_59090 [Calothrix parasitica NIES-267]|uniref:HEAT repeat domain-containing protein n=1 Tax=Calothrix parasitica NIES-267 TaxID=1973488 RepID=A0A1Z4LYV6_9CYAN|nr:hypothetical protein NIES267_59090 [Calothrix parasitica NIES-267]